MKLFSVRADDEDWRHQGSLEAQHRWRLPGIGCSVCGHIWSGTGLYYPSIELPVDLESAISQSGPRVCLEKFKQLASLLRARFGEDLYVKPGTEFGPLSGISLGKHGDFAWGSGSVILIAPPVCEALTESCVKGLVTVKTNVVPKGKRPFIHLELVLEPAVSMSLNGFPEPCAGCGWLDTSGTDFEKWDDYELLGATIPPELDLFRMKEYPGYVFATEKFVSEAQRLQLTGVKFTEVCIV